MIEKEGMQEKLKFRVNSFINKNIPDNSKPYGTPVIINKIDK
jgi:hypothetical protein